jgi:Secretion system C-terminal sorting domain
MKNNYLIAFLFLLFLSAVIIANINETDLIGCTELNGSGCVCHSLDIDSSVTVWVEGPDTLLAGETGLYRMFMTGGPAQGGGYNVAGRFGSMVLVDSFSYQNEYVSNELTQAFSLPFPTPQDTIYWNFGYTPADTAGEWDTIYSCGLSLIWDSIPDFHDRWNYGPKFPIRVLSQVTDAGNLNHNPNNFKLFQNYPNPFNPSTSIDFYMPYSTNVKLTVYDATGSEVGVLIDSFMESGNHSVNFNAGNLSSGIYFYSIETQEIRLVNKMLLLK